MSVDDTVMKLARQVVEQAENGEAPGADWRALLAELEVRIRRADEELALRTVVPKDLRDDYRQEIDTLALDNMQLAAKLADAEAVIERTKAAYSGELRHTMLLEQKLNDMERRLSGVIHKRGLRGESERGREA